MLCDFSNDAMTCATCGYRAKSLPTYRECRPVPPKRWKPVMVGDLVEKTLTSVGVTQERVERWTRTENQPGGCGCEQRKRWLNDAGVKVQLGVKHAAESVARFYLGETTPRRRAP